MNRQTIYADQVLDWLRGNVKPLCSCGARVHLPHDGRDAVVKCRCASGHTLEFEIVERPAGADTPQLEARAGVRMTEQHKLLTAAMRELVTADSYLGNGAATSDPIALAARVHVREAMAQIEALVVLTETLDYVAREQAQEEAKA